MLNMLISFACSALSSALMMRFVTGNMWLTMAVSVVVFAVVFILITRSIMKKVGDLMQTAQHDVMANRSEKAIKELQNGLKYGAWQLYVKQQIYSQIGSIYYLKRQFNEAVPYLEKGFVRNWVSQSMLAITYMKKNKTSKMIETFAKAVSGNREEPMVYAVYAYCLDRVGERTKAIDVLKKGIAKTNADERLQENLTLLEAGKKMKMKGFGDMWYQFHLEKQGAIIKKQTKAMTGRRKQVLR
jgi:tetratricopeptide (TPR) repeat protein